VAILVKIDDFGLYLTKKNFEKIGTFLINLMPYVMKGLGIIGTIAMFLVAGGIFSHLGHFSFLENQHLQNLILGLIGGSIAFCLLSLGKKVFKKA
jgi:predicted DNA repair protein MutK